MLVYACVCVCHIALTFEQSLRALIARVAANLLAFSAARLSARLSRICLFVFRFCLHFFFSALFVLVTVQIDCSLKLMKCLLIYYIASIYIIYLS